MKLIPKIANAEIEPGSIKVYADKASLELAQSAMAHASELAEINEAEHVAPVVEAARELHKWLTQIESSRTAAKRQFLDTNKAIDTLAKKIALPIKSHYDRLTKLLADWHDAERARQEAVEKQQREAEEAIAAEARAKAEELERKRQALIEAQAKAQSREELEQASMDLEFLDSDIPVEVGTDLEAIEIPVLTAPKAPIEGARTMIRRKFVLVDPVAAYQYDKRLVRWDLSILTAQDIVRLMEDRGLEIQIPGVAIETYTDVTVPNTPPNTLTNG
jgi:hypothetical protein